MAEFDITFDGDHSAQFNFDFDDGNDFEANLFDKSDIVAPTNHNELLKRDVENAHPISAITGLEERLKSIEDSAVTAEERESWNNKSRVYRNASGALIITK